MEIKDLLKNRRIDLGLTLVDVADAVGVKAATVSRWESGDIENMRRDRIEALAKVLQLSPLVILGYEPIEDNKSAIARRLQAYADRLGALKEGDRETALKLIDGVIRTFEE